ncbi:translesion DNA synthesis-associated protein ImuA [Nevskia soli]|uniref:translesion DNA synthesis-associated protein ImuA n=1 Tax=Nevskia soli TaxID=418856 RepID=UPI000689290D|nr:translesion DNA synthesis-associated protein ImuA [Nevskia soli]
MLATTTSTVSPAAPALRGSVDVDAIAGVWRGLGRSRPDSESTGIAPLDQALLGGWPVGALSQIVSRESGLGFSLVVPLLARLTRAGRHVALIAPPYIPYAPALRDAGVDLHKLLWIAPKDRVDALWATEQMLRSGLHGAVALWSPALEAPIERRLQLAAETGRSIGIVAHAGAYGAHSIAAVRLQVTPMPAALSVEIVRCRGARPGQRVECPFPLRRAA